MLLDLPSKLVAALNPVATANTLSIEAVATHLLLRSLQGTGAKPCGGCSIAAALSGDESADQARSSSTSERIVQSLMG